MNRNELQALHNMLTEARTLAHEAYTAALKNIGVDGTEAAYQTLLKVNQARDKVYTALLALAGS